MTHQPRTGQPARYVGPRWIRIAGCLLVAVGLAGGAWATYAQDAAREPGPQTPALMAVEPARPDQVIEVPPGELLVEGRRAYELYCTGCHGARGDGQGPAARFLSPKPRDFTTAIFKFSSRPSGGLPTDRDLMQTLDHGLAGTSMREWRLLPTHTKLALIAYIKSFAADRWADLPDEDQPIAIPEDPWAYGDEAAGRARGELVYHGVATCWQCHASYVPVARIDAIRAELGLPASTVRESVMTPTWQQDRWGQRVWPPEFTQDRIKYGTDVRTLYRIIAAGIGGTAMPAWKGVLADDDIWAMAYFVHAQAEKRDERVVHGAAVAGE